MAWSVDRLGRSLQDLVAFLSDIHPKGIDLYLIQRIKADVAAQKVPEC